MTENRMKEIAKILGVELNEEFYIKKAPYNPYKITDGGLFNSEGFYVSNTFMELLKGEYKIDYDYKTREKFLSSDEMEYLETVLKPFYNKVDYIQKASSNENSEEYIFAMFKKDECINMLFLLSFKSKTLYKGMELDKPYTLEELGLFVD